VLEREARGVEPAVRVEASGRRPEAPRFLPRAVGVGGAWRAVTRIVRARFDVVRWRRDRDGVDAARVGDQVHLLVTLVANLVLEVGDRITGRVAGSRDDVNPALFDGHADDSSPARSAI
jgi:hypothetical protein